MLAGTQGGKTCFGPDWLYREIQNKGEGDYLIATATFPLLRLKLEGEFLALFRDILRLGTYRESDRVFEFDNDRIRVILASATNPESIESATAKGAWLDEAGQKQFRREANEAINRRLSLHRGRKLYTTTPYGLGWLKNEVYDLASKPNSDIEVISFPSTSNPAFPLDEYERAKNMLPRWKFEMFYNGRFERPVGLVHDSFGPQDIIDRFPIDKSWPVYVGHDFGIANPAALFTAQNPATGELIYWQEYLPGAGRSPYDHVQAWQKITAGYNVIARVGGNHQEQEIRDAYSAHGWHIIEPLQRSVNEQIMRVLGQERLHKIKVFRDLANIIDEKQSFSYKLDDKYNPTNEFEDEKDYHLSACERYLHTYFTPETVKPTNGARPRANYST